MNEQHLRMSDAERDQAAAELGEHYAQGRLTSEEHLERLDRIWAARTRGELAPIFRDLPGRAAYAAPTRTRRPTARQSRWLPVPWLVVFGIVAAVTILTKVPIILVALVGWFFLMSRRGACRTERR